VYNSSGELVKVILVTHTTTVVNGITGESDTVIDRVGDVVDLYWQGEWYGAWDGTNADGKAVANGEYYVKVDSVDSYGVTKTVTMDVTVNRKVARLDITIYNAAGEAVRHLTSVEAADLGANVNAVALSTDVIQPNTNLAGVASTLTINLPNGTTAVWDGRSDTGATVADGQYYVEVKTEGDGGETTVVVKTVAVLCVSAGKTVTAMPNVLSKANPTTRFVAAAGTTVKVVVYSTAGEKVAAVWGAPGSGEAVWDSTPAASGFYLAVASTYDTAGRLLGRMVLKINVGK
jgi:flagellar hook assembly protein FlgD